MTTTLAELIRFLDDALARGRTQLAAEKKRVADTADTLAMFHAMRQYLADLERRQDDGK